MIIEFLVTLVLIIANSLLCSVINGGCGSELVQLIEMFGFTGILALFILISGYGKSFLRIFAIPSKNKCLSLSEMKSVDDALKYAIKASVFIGVFFLLAGASYFYINLSNSQTFGINLATVILSLFYMLLICLILLVLKSKNKKQMIEIMGEADDDENISVESKKAGSFGSVIKTFVSIILILVIGFYVIKCETKNETDFNFTSVSAWIDLPSVVELFVLSFAFLAVSGNFRIFWKSVKAVFMNRKISITQKNLYVNAIQTLRTLILLTGITCTLIGFMALLCNLEDKSMLGYNMQVALITGFYAVVCGMILLPFETKICRLGDL